MGASAQKRVHAAVESHRTWLMAVTPSHTWGSVASKALVCVSHSAAARMSASRMQPLLLLNAKTLQCEGWKSAAVITCGQPTGPQSLFMSSYMNLAAILLFYIFSRAMLDVLRRCKDEAHLLMLCLQHGVITIAKQQPLVLADVRQSAPSMLPQDSSTQHAPRKSVHDQSAPSHFKTLFQAPTSVRSSMLAGLMSTMLKLWSLVPRCHRFTRRSSALMNVSWFVNNSISSYTLRNGLLEEGGGCSTCGALKQSAAAQWPSAVLAESTDVLSSACTAHLVRVHADGVDVVCVRRRKCALTSRLPKHLCHRNLQQPAGAFTE
jgi:hypothetical protein